MKTILKMENVKKSFGSGHNEIQALKGIDLAVNQGEFVSIITIRKIDPTKAIGG